VVSDVPVESLPAAIDAFEGVVELGHAEAKTIVNGADGGFDEGGVGFGLLRDFDLALRAVSFE